jgi:hypothetical protein
MSFLNAFDTPGNSDGIVTEEEFVNYYRVISATVREDEYFGFLLNQVYSF